MADTFWPVLLGLLGLVFGSFIATLAIRWPQERSVVTGRSRCDHCATPLSAIELVPLLGFLLLRGRCRHCSGPIAWSHPVIELLGLGIGVVAGIVAPGAAGVGGAVFGWLLLAAGAIDLAAFWLPDRVTLALAATGLGAGMVGLPPSLPDRMIGGLTGFGALWLVAAAYHRVRRRVGLGGGDPKLMGAIGLWLGWRALPGVLLAACAVGIGWAVLSAIRGRAVRGDDRLPLGTLLAVAAFPAWAIGASVAS